MDFRRLRPWLLVASLAANGFLAGMLLVGRPPHPPGPPPGPHDVVEQMAAILPAADAGILRQAAADQGVDGPPQPGDFDDDHRRATELMAAETFDTAAFSQLVAAFAAKREQAGDRVGKMLVQALPRMSLEGRRALANLRPPPPGPPPGKGGR